MADPGFDDTLSHTGGSIDPRTLEAFRAVGTSAADLGKALEAMSLAMSKAISRTVQEAIKRAAMALASTTTATTTRCTTMTEMTDWKLIDEILALDAVRTAYVWGPPGMGKTYAAIHSGRTDRGVSVLTLTEETPAAELRGHFVPKGHDMVWHDGPMIRAMRAGGRLVVNEITHGGPDCWSFLMPILESIETARITLPSGETIQPAPGFHVICTDNCPPTDLPAALRDRFDVQFRVATPHDSAINALPDDLRSHARQTVALEGDRAISLRGWGAYARLRGPLGEERAARAVFGREKGQQIYSAVRIAPMSPGAAKAATDAVSTTGTEV